MVIETSMSRENRFSDTTKVIIGIVAINPSETLPFVSSMLSFSFEIAADSKCCPSLRALLNSY